jgi:hypothetical protein
MSIAGHVSRAVLSRYSLVRMEAKRRALDGIAARQRAADQKRRDEIEKGPQSAVVSQPAISAVIRSLCPVDPDAFAAHCKWNQKRRQ